MSSIIFMCYLLVVWFVVSILMRHIGDMRWYPFSFPRFFRYYGVEECFPGLVLSSSCKQVAAFARRAVWEEVYHSCWQQPLLQVLFRHRRIFVWSV